jgi:2-keto-4-pentenoate hydratase
MYEEEVKDVIKVNTDEREASIEERERRAKAVGSTIARFFEQHNYSTEVSVSIEYRGTVFTHNKTMTALEFASDLMKSKGYVLGFFIVRKSTENFFRVVAFIAGKVEETDDFKEAIERALAEDTNDIKKAIKKHIKKA